MVATVDWLQPIFDADVERAIRADASRVKELAQSGALADLKKAVEDERTGVEARVRSVFQDRPEYWSHIDAQVFAPNASGSSVPRFDETHVHGAKGSIEKPLRRLRGRVLLHLVKAGLAADYRGRGVALPYSADDEFPYPYGMDVSSEMDSQLKEYRSIYKRFVALYTERDALRREIEEASATDLWDRA